MSQTQASAAPARKKSKPHRWKPGTVALREISKQQKSVTTACPKQAVERVIREIAMDYKEDVRFNKTALLAAGGRGAVPHRPLQAVTETRDPRWPADHNSRRPLACTCRR